MPLSGPGTARTNRAFTLVEMLACTAIAAVLGLTIGSALAVAVRMSLQARRPVELKKDATHALRLIQKTVRQRSPDQIQISDDGGTLTVGGGPERVLYFQKAEADLLFFDGEKAMTLVDDKTEDITFALTPGHRAGDFLLSASLKLSHEGCTLQIESLTKLRNQQGAQ